MFDAVMPEAESGPKCRPPVRVAEATWDALIGLNQAIGTDTTKTPVLKANRRPTAEMTLGSSMALIIE
jgi:hypothetical protein